MYLEIMASVLFLYVFSSGWNSLHYSDCMPGCSWGGTCRASPLFSVGGGVGWKNGTLRKLPAYLLIDPLAHCLELSWKSCKTSCPGPLGCMYGPSTSQLWGRAWVCVGLVRMNYPGPTSLITRWHCTTTLWANRTSATEWIRAVGWTGFKQE